MLYTSNEETIIALCTPRGSGALALVRLSGLNAFEMAEKLARLSSEKKITECATHTIHHGYVVDSALPPEAQPIDEVMFLLMRGPKTFTGQDTVEITTHNNPFIIDHIISVATRAGARLAAPGEFTRRAVLNDKLDIIQAEALNELIHAQSAEALKRSMGQLKGSLSRFVAGIEEKIVKLLAIVEASFEFLDEEQRDLAFDELIKDQLRSIRGDLEGVLASFSMQQQIKEGVRIALIGSVNAGKSTLFNALLGKERAIVTPHAGTTRDSIEAGVYRNGLFWTLVDTAGLRTTDDSIEQQGIERSWQEAAKADIVLLVIDVSGELDAQQAEVYNTLLTTYPSKTVIVAHKIDCPFTSTAKTFLSLQPALPVSSKEKRGLKELENALEKKVHALFEQCSSPFLLTKRNHGLLGAIDSKLGVLEESFQQGIAHELVAYALKECLELANDLTGKNVQEKMFDAVFRDFCVGK